MEDFQLQKLNIFGWTSSIQWAKRHSYSLLLYIFLSEQYIGPILSEHSADYISATFSPLVEKKAHKVNLKIKSGVSLTLKSFKQPAHSVKSFLVLEKKAGGVNFMG